MALAAEILLTAACAGGLMALLWWLFGRLIRPIPPHPGQFVLIPGRGMGDGLEQTLLAHVWLRSLGLLRCPILIADIDLTPEGRELALRLAARWPGVSLWPAGELTDYITCL